MNERPNIEQIKAELAVAIVRSLEEHKLTDMAASYRLTLAPTEVGRLRIGDLTAFSVDHLISLLNVLEQRANLTITSDVRIESAASVEPGEHSDDENPLLSIIKYMEELNAKIPPAEFDRLPTDLAQNLDHYLYGAKKSD
jgi:predicted XRE-type DNA-binding protein